MISFDPRNWFWIVGEDASKAWSSAAASYVASWDEDRLSRISNEVELYDVLAKVGAKSKAPSRVFTCDEIRAALLKIDAAETDDATDVSSLSVVAERLGINLPAFS